MAEYVPGKILLITDTLSRSQQMCTKEVTDRNSEVECLLYSHFDTGLSSISKQN